jgi:zinc protease
LVALSTTATAGSPPTAAPAKVFPYPTHVTTLDNGLEVIIVPMPAEGLVAYWSIVRTGSRDEYEPGRTGFAHFFEHMMFRGTAKFPADVYGELVTKMGADANAFTSDDITAYHLGFATEDLDTVMQIESDRFQNLDYPEQSFKTEAGAVYGEYRKNRSSPFFTLSEAVQKTAFTQHTYSHTTMGYEADIKAMPEAFEYGKSFFGRYYRPENVVLLIVGDVDAEAALAKVKTYYSGWKPGYVAPTIPVEPEQTAERRVEVSYEGRSLPILQVSYKSAKFDPADRQLAAASLLAQLAFGETSALYRQLVLDQQAVEFLAAEQGMSRDPGTFDIVTRIKDPAKVDSVLAAIDGAIAAYQQTPVDAKRLSDLKSGLKYGFLMGLDTPNQVASSLARLLAITGSMSSVDTLYTTYDAVTAQDVQDAARRILQPTRRTIAILRGTK